MQIVGRACEACEAPVAVETDARVCLACERVYHRACVAKECPRCRGQVASAKKANAQRTATEASALADQIRNGKSLFLACAAVYGDPSATPG